jgi:hypothetical protein
MKLRMSGAYGYCDGTQCVVCALLGGSTERGMQGSLSAQYGSRQDLLVLPAMIVARPYGAERRKLRVAVALRCTSLLGAKDRQMGSQAVLLDDLE